MRRFHILVIAISVMFLSHFANAQTGSSWEEATSNAQWSARSRFGAVVFNNRMWVLGGNSGGNGSNDVWSSSDGTNWTKATPAAPWHARSYQAAVVFNGRMWVLGGGPGTGEEGNYYNDVWSSSDGTNWTQATSAAPWSGRSAFGSVVFNNQMWVLGGTGNSASYLHDVWSSSNGTNWTQVTLSAPWSARYRLAAVVFNNRMWVLGGGNGSYLNDVWSTPDGTNWTEATPVAAWGGRTQLGVDAINNRIWVLGGFNGSHLNDVWSSSDGTNWTEATPPAPWSTRSAFGSVVFNNQMWVLGGEFASSTSDLNDVWSSPPIPLTVANFTATPTNGLVPLTVTFTDMSIGSITNWFWDFGDGGTTNLATNSVVYVYKSRGVYTVSETVSGPTGISSAVQTNYIVVNCPVITLSPNGSNPTVLPGATAGLPYSQSIVASGGAGTYTYTTTAGMLPTGLNLSAAGALSGTSAVASTYAFTITATDTNGCTGSQAYSLTVTCPTITLSPATLPFAMGGVPYNQTITASGGNGPYTFALTGTLPNGATLSSAGVFSGIPTETGLFPIRITATDQFTGCTGTQSYTLRVDCAAIALSPITPSSGTVGSAYGATITPSGGVPPYAFFVSSGSLPADLNLDLATGVISGTPTVAGSFSFDVAVYDANGCPGGMSYTLQMNCPAIALSSLPNGIVSTPYNQTITASGGTSPYTFSLLDGMLPPGLSLSPSGVLSGTPTMTTNVSFTLQANDTYNCSGTQQYTVATCGPFAITAITAQSNDIRVTWSGPGTHGYVLQSTRSTAMIAQYTTNFTDISPTIMVSGLGTTTTNYLDAGAAYAPVLTAPGGSIVTTSVVPSTVSISATGTRGIEDSLGNGLPIGCVVMLGTFTITDATIQSNFLAGNVSAIMSNFTLYGASFKVGDGTTLPASWTVSQSAPGFGGRQIYLLVVDKPTVAAASHLGIYSAPSWTFPADGSQTDIDLADVTDFVIGAQGGSLTINLPIGGQTYTFTDTARLAVLPGRILFYRVRLAQ
ncbi:MAG TPA: putative Ig domain-containing protein [Verrucomicrobiae bacterium]|nr:putative Ig domain-containing protein [Verrucomicrobiae bacterium]